MRTKESVVRSWRPRGCGAVSLNPPGVKSSVKRRPGRGRVLRRLPQRSSCESQMANDDAGDRKRQPKRRLHGDGDERTDAAMSENVPMQPGKKMPGERRGKENSAAKSAASAEPKISQSIAHDAFHTREDPSVFLDEDSNHVFPVERFFGNMDVVEDFPRRIPGSKRLSRREYRNTHYYAKEDSEEEQP